MKKLTTGCRKDQKLIYISTVKKVKFWWEKLSWKAPKQATFLICIIWWKFVYGNFHSKSSSELFLFSNRLVYKGLLIIFIHYRQDFYDNRKKNKIYLLTLQFKHETFNHIELKSFKLFPGPESFLIET